MTFTNNWFDVTARGIWNQLIPQINPKTVLEIGSYEGASACYLIEHCPSLTEIHCVDTWEGGIDHAGIDMAAVEQRFNTNTTLAIRKATRKVALVLHKMRSRDALRLCDSINYFDLIYIDGSHQATDVLSDAVLSFPLLKVSGTMIFDDYTWRSDDPFDCPKHAIDAFLNIYAKKMRLASSFNSQVVATKVSD